MPSGAKKRKAAKKKKTNKTQLHGEGDELVVHDGKDSDGGEVNSPLSHHDAADDDLHVAAVGDDDDDDDKEEEDPPSVRSIAVVENEPLLAENGESTLKVTVVEEIAIENKPTNQDPEIHENPSGGDSDDDSDSSSSGSKSSDEESQAIETTKKNIVMADSNEAVALELSNPVIVSELKDEELAESPPSLLDLSSKPDDFPTEITQSKLSSDAADVIELDTALLTSDESVDIAEEEITKVEIAKVETAEDEITNVEIAKDEIPRVEIAKDEIPRVEIAKDEIPKVEIAKDEIPKVEIAKDEILKNGEIRLKENEIKVDKQVSTRVLETTTVTATVLSSSTVVSTAVTNNFIDQPRVVVTTPKPTQRSSLVSCCGLFELFTGSHR